MEHLLAKSIIITRVIELIANHYKISIEDARDRLYNSQIIDLIEDDETGLYGDSPLSIFSIYKEQQKKISQ